MITSELVQEVVNGGVAVILSVGLIVILYTAIAESASERHFLNQHMERQTTAIEKLVKIYWGQ